ncbi:MAG: HNH endonuclease [Bacteroidota bacterium]
MATTLTRTEWIEILQDKRLTYELDIAIFQTLYSFDEHKAAASQVGRILGSDSKMPGSKLNLEIGRYAKRIANHYEINFTARSKQKFKFWDLFFNGSYDDKGVLFYWQLKKQLIEALEETGLTGDEQFADEIPFDREEKLFEGAKRTIVVNAYERNSKARQLCIEHYGTTCSVCEFDFEKTYGELGKDFIHVHHLTPVSEIGNNYEINPVKDLRPVCPNCHSMLHRQEPPLTIEELISLMR